MIAKSAGPSPRALDGLARQQASWAESCEERVAVLVARRTEVAEDCCAARPRSTTRSLSQRRLLVDALADRHDEAARSLAVLMADTAVLQAAAARHIEAS